jgi:hypothetical protein
MDDLHLRLERLAPPIDVDDALAGVKRTSRRRRSRQRGALVAAMAVAVVVLVAGLAVTGGGADDADVIASEPDGAPAPGTSVVRRTGTTRAAEPEAGSEEPTATTSTSAVAGPTPPSVPAPSTTAPRSTDTTAGGPDPVELPSGPVAAPSEVEVRVTPERSTVPVGERVRYRVDVLNHSAKPARLTSGGCGPVRAELDAPGFAAGSPTAETWAFGFGTLAPFAATHDVAPRRFPSFQEWGTASVACTADLRVDEVAPGASLTRTFVWDAVVGVPWTGSTGTVTVGASVQVIPSATGVDGEVRRGSAPVTVADDGRAHASPSTFLSAVEWNNASGPWIDSHFGTRWDVEVGYARGGFEIWFRRGNLGLRVRGDTATGAVTEVRSLDPRRAPSDDPDSTFTDPGEKVLFPY